MTWIKCLEPECERIGCYRGLCTKHYGRYNRKVRAGEVTWAELEEAGKCKIQIRGKDGSINPNYEGLIRW